MESSLSWALIRSFSGTGTALARHALVLIAFDLTTWKEKGRFIAMAAAILWRAMGLDW
tara:strand:- start:343 stop:516 length:174 start_codon:yes stop_codon:yes gene_type:complete